MPLAPVTLANVYEMIFTMENTATGKQWRNSYSFYSPSTPVSGDNAADHLYRMQIAMVRSDSKIVKQACYAWARGTQPYPLGMPIWEATLAAVGTADAAWLGLVDPTYEPTGGEVCLRMDHEPLAGNKPGRTFFRGFLGKLDISATTVGKWVLIALIGAFQAVLDTILASSNVNDLFASGASPQKLVVVRYSPKTNTVHGYTAVTAFTLIGATTNKVNRKSKK